MHLEIRDHLTEGRAHGLLGGLHIYVFLGDHDALRVFLDELQLCGDRETLLLLLLRGDAGIDHRMLAPVIGFRGLDHLVRVNWTSMDHKAVTPSAPVRRPAPCAGLSLSRWA